MTASDVPDQHTVEACARAWHLLRQAHGAVERRLATELDRECALAINEFDVLLHLRLHGEGSVRIGALLDIVPLSQPALSRLVARLEARGLLVRSESGEDGRAIVVSLTDAGAALIDRAVAIHARSVHEALTGQFTPEEQAALLQALSRIAR